MRILPNHDERVELIGKLTRDAEATHEETTHNRVRCWNHPTGIVHSFVGGSDLHGAKVGDGGDLDIFAIAIERPEFGMGIHGGYSEPSWETFQWSTASDTRQNTETDVDVTVHTLRKWARLAASGNPTILNFMFVPLNEHWTIWNEIAKHTDLFLAQSHTNAFLGYAKQQHDRLNGKKATNTNRPELVEKYGYDVKMAMHMIRLMLELREFLMWGKITFPSLEKDLLINIRSGKYLLQEVNDMYTSLYHQCEDWKNASGLPEQIDRGKISKLISDLYRMHWETFDWQPLGVRWV